MMISFSLMAEGFAVIHSHFDQELMDVAVCRVQIRRTVSGRRGVSQVLLVMRDWYVVLQSAMCLISGAHRYAGCEAEGSDSSGSV